MAHSNSSRPHLVLEAEDDDLFAVNEPDEASASDASDLFAAESIAPGLVEEPVDAGRPGVSSVTEMGEDELEQAWPEPEWCAPPARRRFSAGLRERVAPRRPPGRGDRAHIWQVTVLGLALTVALILVAVVSFGDREHSSPPPRAAEKAAAPVRRAAPRLARRAPVARARRASKRQAPRPSRGRRRSRPRPIAHSSSSASPPAPAPPPALAPAPAAAAAPAGGTGGGARGGYCCAASPRPRSSGSGGGGQEFGFEQ